MSTAYQSFGVIGAGAWGTALAQTLASAGRDVTLWAFETDVVNSINQNHENSLYLKGASLNPAVRATNNLADLAGKDAILVVTPAQHMRGSLAGFIPHARDGLPMVLCSKGIEISSRKFMSEVLEEILPNVTPAVLSGPSFAADVVKGLPTAVTLACSDWDVGAKLISSIAAPTFRPYYSQDVIGAEIGGAVKNVLAIVCGLVLGKGLGRSAHAAIIARGYAEMVRLGKALGCNPETLTGLCGLGDLVLTCSSEQSRNMSFGMALGKGQSYEDYMKDKNVVVEGAATAPALKALSLSKGVEMPISHALANILDGSEQVDTAISRLLAREHKTEILS